MENLRGILLMVLAMAGFAVQDALFKAISTRLPIGEIVLVVGILGGASFALLARAQGLNVVSPVLLIPSVLGRNLCEIVGAMGMVTAIAALPLSTVSSIQQAIPLVITMGAALFLGETVGWRRWSAVIFGFAGVLLIVRPGGAAFEPMVLWAILGMLGLAARDLFVRRVPEHVPHLLLATYGFASTIPAGLILLLASGGAHLPSLTDALMLVACALVGVTSYYALVSATRAGDVAVVTPFRYTRLPFALAIAMLAFAERPDVWTYLGAFLILLSGLYTFLRERKLARAAQSTDALA